MEKKKTVAYIGGTFDLFHYGHVQLLKSAKELFDEVVVSLNTDEFAARYKRAPVMNFDERWAVLRACKYVDKLVTNDSGEDSRPAILHSKATHVILGSDWAASGKAYAQLGFDEKWLKLYNITLLFLPYTKGISTSDIIARIKG